MTTIESRPSRTFDARALLRESLVWDNHGCMPMRPHDLSFMPQLQRYRDAGVDVAIINAGFGDMGIEQHVRMLAAMRHWLLQRPDQYVVIDTVDDIDTARASGRLAVGFDIEGANAVDDQISLVQLYHDLGVRWMLLAYNLNNRAGGGCQDQDGGLTGFGRSLVREMERVGMQVCCSHTGHRTVRDVFEIATKPVIFSHSNPSALHDHPRNIPDDLIRACAATGGVVGINGIGSFLGKNDNSNETFVRHVDHVVQLVGIEHVSIGLDYVFDRQELDDYVVAMAHTFPPGLGYDKGVKLVEPEQLEGIVGRLGGLGYAIEDLRLLLGGNLYRLAGATWKRRTPLPRRS